MRDFEVAVANKLWIAKEKTKAAVHNFLVDEEGDTNFISIIVVLVIVLGLAVVFRQKIGQITSDLWAKVTGNVTEATKDF